MHSDNGGGKKKKKGGEMEGLVMRKVRVRLCLIVYCGGDGRRDGGKVRIGRRGPKLSSVGLLLLQAIFLCVCMCVFVYVSSAGEMRRYEIQLWGYYFFLFFLRMSCGKNKKKYVVIQAESSLVLRIFSFAYLMRRKKTNQVPELIGVLRPNGSDPRVALKVQQ